MSDQDNMIAMRQSDDSSNKQDNNKNHRQIKVNIPGGMNIMFSDSVFMTVSPHGDVVMDFAQSMGTSPQQNVVSRIGLSKEHAKNLLRRLNKMLEDIED